MFNTGFSPAKILLPNVLDMQTWSVIACDQFEAEKDYWEELRKKVGDSKSTLNLILPEIYLNDDADGRIKKINATMKEYLLSNTFTELEEGFILTVRKTAYKDRRIGLIGKIDLENYEYSDKSEALIRSTEKTIEERIPPRLKVRKDADIEFPHIMILFDDEKREINEELYKNRNSFKKVYDFELNMEGGHIEGYFISKTDEIMQKFSSLLEDKRLISKYGKSDKFAFAVGDGNHSLATAKAHWNNVKKNLTEEKRKVHPARFALVEAVNIYDDGIYFEPIYRFVSKIDVDKFISLLKDKDFGDVKLYYKGKEQDFLGKKSLPEGIKEADAFIKDYIDKFGGKIEYVHGDKSVKALADKTEGSIAILFKKLKKEDLFKFVSEKGSLPRKTFSMGEAREKRYYLEGRKIK